MWKREARGLSHEFKQRMLQRVGRRRTGCCSGLGGWDQAQAFV